MQEKMKNIKSLDSKFSMMRILIGRTNSNGLVLKENLLNHPEGKIELSKMAISIA
jgi:hypothetical protein